MKPLGCEPAVDSSMPRAPSVGPRVAWTRHCLGVFAALLPALAQMGCNDEPVVQASATRAPEPTKKKLERVIGKDGSATLTAGSNVVNGYTALAQDAASGDTELSVADAAELDVSGLGPIATGDLVLVYQAQGASITTNDDADYGAVSALGSAGRYELVEVNGVSGNTLQLSCALGSSYTSAGGTEVVRVPQYTDFTIPSGATLTGSAWNGTGGGVVAIHTDTLVLDGNIDATGLGFRGGATDNLSVASGANETAYVSTSATAGGRKGESIAGAPNFYQTQLNGAFGRGAPANAGGGGTAHNAGGGGGANGHNGAVWTGQGVMDGSVTGAAAWFLDPAAIANSNQLTASAGGGRGGYTYASDNEDALSIGPGSVAWGGNLRRERGGLGGRPLESSVDTRLFLGGGGGAGDGNNNGAGAGGRGEVSSC